MTRTSILLILQVLLAFTVSAQKPFNSFKVVFYNTENIFDTIDDPNTSDEEFLPGSKVAWTAQRYQAKIGQIARVLAAIDSADLPAVIGLAEVENSRVLQDVISDKRLQPGQYKGILEEGEDPRGIDGARIYRPDRLKYMEHKAFPSAASFKTRSILYVPLVNQKEETFHIFVNHWKSRQGGGEITEVQRIENATFLKRHTDSLLAINPKSYIIILGDFNDEPSNKSISETLKAEPIGRKIKPQSLYNLMYERYSKGEGTLYYKDWDLFDQIMVSGSLLTAKPRKKPSIKAPYSYIFKEDWMLYKNKTGDMIPNRTASSREYFGGYSDHLPVYTVVSW